MSNARGYCPVCRHPNVRLCVVCGVHVYWCQLWNGTVTPVGAHDGTVHCRG